MKRIALWLLIGSVALSALMGIWALVVGEFGELEGKVLLTALSVTCLSILTMACGVAWERGRLRFVPHVGAVTSLLSFLLFVPLLWGEVREDLWWKTAASLTLVALACAHACLLSLARLVPRFRWAQWLGYLCAYLLVTILIALLWSEWDGGDWVWRALGVLAILLAAATVGVPLLHRMSASEAIAAAPRREVAVRFCVSCGASLDAVAGEVVCSACGGRFRVDFSVVEGESGPSPGA